MFNWRDLYAQVARGLNDPEWEGYSKKTRNRHKRERIAQARAAVLNYEQRRGLVAGSLTGGEDAGVAPRVPPGQGQLALPGAAASSAAMPPPPADEPAQLPLSLEGVAPSPSAGAMPKDSVYAALRACRLSALESQLFAPDDESSVWGGEVQALPSQVLTGVVEPILEVPLSE